MSLLAKFLFGFILTSVVLALSTFSANEVTSAVSPGNIDENTPTVTITFTELIDGTDYDICIYTDENDCNFDHKRTFFTEQRSDEDGNIQITVCGDTSAAVKLNCDSGDFFHPVTYKLHVFKDENKINTTQFAVAKYVPDVTFLPEHPKPTDDHYSITITGHRRPADIEDRNKYEFDFFGLNGAPNPDELDDLTVPGDQPSAIREFGPFEGGAYHLNIRYKNESFVLWEITFTVRGDGGDVVYKKNVGGDRSAEAIVTSFILSCGGEIGGVKEPDCPGIISTPLGDIPTNPAGLTTIVLRFAIGIAGGVAFLMLIYGGFKFMFSMGNPENVQQGREIITAAIIGLIVIIFSVFLLRLIGISILGLPI